MFLGLGIYKTNGGITAKITKMEYSKIDNIEFGDVWYEDAMNFSDAFIVSADYNGKPMNDAQLDVINNDSEFIHEQLIKFLF